MIYKAQPTADVPVPDLCITATEECPRDGTLTESLRRHEEAAAEIDDKLFASLPGGTYDHLLCLMLKRKASLFVVAHDNLKAAFATVDARKDSQC